MRSMRQGVLPRITTASKAAAADLSGNGIAAEADRTGGFEIPAGRRHLDQVTVAARVDEQVAVVQSDEATRRGRLQALAAAQPRTFLPRRGGCRREGGQARCRDKGSGAEAGNAHGDGSDRAGKGIVGPAGLTRPQRRGRQYAPAMDSESNSRSLPAAGPSSGSG
jgi:hypothetical protein